MAKRALVTGITGQDGAYLAAHLLNHGYEVYGAQRRTATSNIWRLEELGIAQQVKLMPMDLLEFGNILSLVKKVAPDEVYNLAAQSFVGSSFDQPLYTGDVDALGVTRILEAIRAVKPDAKFYQASTSEMFGKVQEVPQTERTPFHPRSPYGVAKLYGHWITVNYRESYNTFAASGILFNHESPLRGQDFVTRKITLGLARLRKGAGTEIRLGNLEARRDWGFAGDYVRGMHAMLQQSEPEDFVLATGETHSVRNFVESAARAAGFDLEWRGEGLETQGVDRKSGQTIISIDPEFHRPAEVDLLIGDPAKAREKLGWKAEVTFDGLVEQMVKADVDRIAKGQITL